MRAAPVLGALALAVAVGQPVRGQSPPDTRFVTAAEAEVRSGPSLSTHFYVTNKLRKGDPVHVVAEQDGWLKIEPPEGSFSWINTFFLKHIVPNEPNLVTIAEDVRVPVYIGSSFLNARPTVVGAKLARGTQVTSVGKTMADSDGTWMPIQPPPGEFRWIRAEAVTSRPPAPAERSLKPPAGGAPGTDRSHSAFVAGSPPPSTAPHAGPPPSPEELWQRAVQADRTGNTDEAIRLYAQVAAETVSTNRVRSAEALQRAQFLQNNYRSTGVASAPAPAPAPVATIPSQTQVRAYPVSTEAAAPARPAPRAPAPAPATAPNPRAGTGYPTYTGQLRRAGRAVDDRPTYVLEVRNYPYFYVTPGAGINLEPYVDRNVELTGPAAYRGDLRANYMTAVRVNPIQ